MTSTDGTSGILESRLRLGAGFHAAERPTVLRDLGALERHLAAWDRDAVDVEVSVKDRDGPEQQVTLEAWLPGLPPVVAKSREKDLDRALIEARKELIRQIEDEKDRHRARKPRRT